MIVTRILKIQKKWMSSSESTNFIEKSYPLKIVVNLFKSIGIDFKYFWNVDFSKS